MQLFVTCCLDPLTCGPNHCNTLACRLRRPQAACLVVRLMVGWLNRYILSIIGMRRRLFHLQGLHDRAWVSVWGTDDASLSGGCCAEVAHERGWNKPFRLYVSRAASGTSVGPLTATTSLFKTGDEPLVAVAATPGVTLHGVSFADVKTTTDASLTGTERSALVALLISFRNGLHLPSA